MGVFIRWLPCIPKQPVVIRVAHTSFVTTFDSEIRPLRCNFVRAHIYVPELSIKSDGAHVREFRYQRGNLTVREKFVAGRAEIAELWAASQPFNLGTFIYSMMASRWI